MNYTDLVQDAFIATVKKKTGFEVGTVRRTPGWCYVQAHPHVSERVHFELQQADRIYACFHNEAHGNSYEWRNFWHNATKAGVRLLDWVRNGCIQREVSSLEEMPEVVGKLVDDVMPILNETFGTALAPQAEAADRLLPHGAEVAIVQSVPASDLLQEHLFIPEYQREYCWRPQDVNALFNDIAAFFRRQDSSSCEYHLGTVILKEEAPGEFAVIDGQQRLTTLAIWQFLANGGKSETAPYLLREGMKKKEPTLSPEARNALVSARQAIHDLQKPASSNGIVPDLAGVVLSVIILGQGQPDDLAYTFFSNSNSTGKRLSDFDLLKTHHLRYIQEEAGAREAVRRWHGLEKEGLLDPLLHRSLFRLRNWRSGTGFSFDATANPDRREVYQHFSCAIEEEAFAMQMSQFRFDSILPGGQEFFRYAEYYRRQFEDFRSFPIVRRLDEMLGWHSNGVIRDGVKAIAFLFYCKFGASYLREAVHALAYRLSELRNAYKVLRQYINHPFFREATSLLDRVTTVGQFLGGLLDPPRNYAIGNRGPTACLYWNYLHAFLAEIEKEAAIKGSMQRSALVAIV